MQPGTHHTTTDLLTGLRDGDESAFAQLYEQYYQRVYFIARRLLQLDADTQDVTAEAFIQLWRHRAKFTDPEAIPAFLFTTVRNKAIDLLRKRQTRAAGQVQLEALEGADAEQVFYLEQVRAEMMQEIMATVRTLSPRLQEIFTLAFVEGMKTAEIAEQLQITPHSVTNQKLNLVKLLRASLAHKPALLAAWIVMEQNIF